MSPDDDDIEPRPEIWEKGVIVLAALLTFAALLACYFLVNVPATKAPPSAAEAGATKPSDEVTVGIFPGKPAATH
jgi:hypothetical protein